MKDMLKHTMEVPKSILKTGKTILKNKIILYIMDISELINQYVTEDVAEIVEEYIGPYCCLCNKTFIDKFPVRTVHDGEYQYNECIDKENCINLDEKSKVNPWSSTRNLG